MKKNIKELFINNKKKHGKCTVTVCGFYGAGDIGDDMILYSLIKTGFPINVIGFDPKKIRDLFNVDCVKILSIKHFDVLEFIKMLNMIRKSTLIVIGGGTLFNDIRAGKRDLWSISKYLSIGLFGKLFKKEVITYGVGVENINYGFNRFLLKFLKMFDFVGVRDIESKKILEQLGVTDVKVVGDIVLSLKPKVSHVKKHVIGLCVRDYYDKKITDHLIRTFSGLIDNLVGIGFKVVFFPHFIIRDKTFIFKIINRCKNRNRIKVLFDINIHNVLKRYSECDLIVGIRLHSLIFAYMCDVLMIGIAYEDKINRFMNAIGLKDCVFTLDVDANDLFKKCCELLGIKPGSYKL